MLSKVMEIGQLPPDIEAQLYYDDEFYICSQFTEDFVGPPIIRLGKGIYYRFMRFFYLPQPPESLTTEQVIKICDLRLKYLDKVLNLELNRRIVAALVEHIKAGFVSSVFPIQALDFGCGSGLSLQLLTECLPNLEIVGVDISKKAIEHCDKQGLNAILTLPGEPLPFKTATFDVIFVMHFNVDLITLAELRRVLRDAGKFVFNVYMRDIDGVIHQLQEVGFTTFDVWDISDIIVDHRIVSCSTVPPYKTVFHQFKTET